MNPILDAINQVELPPSVQEDLAGWTLSNGGDDQERLAKLMLVFQAKKKVAIDGRKASGIEEVWTRYEDAYVGIDDANRSEVSGVKWAKPLSPTGPLQAETTRSNQGEEVRSKVFVPLTARYVDAAHAKICEILLPADDKPFSIDPEPDAELDALLDDDRQIVHQGTPLQRDPTEEEAQSMAPSAQPGEAPAVGAPSPHPATMPGQALRMSDVAEEKRAQLEEDAKEEEEKISEWMTLGKFTGNMRKVLFDATRIGTGVLYGPFPDVIRSLSVSKREDQLIVEVIDKLFPNTRWVSPWNFYPDPACGENVRDGAFAFERDDLSVLKVHEMRQRPGYRRTAIEDVLRQGPKKLASEYRTQPNSEIGETFEVWYFVGMLSREDMLLLSKDANPHDPDKDGKQARYDPLEGVDASKKEVFARLTVINDIPVHVAIDPFESNKLLYHVLPWQRRAGSWAGKGIGEQASSGQRIANGALRTMMDNSGSSAGAQIVVDETLITPGDDDWTITGRNKLWYYKGDQAAAQDVGKAFTVFEFPSRQPELQRIFELGEKIVEDSTNIPLISQGQSGPTQPDTLGGLQMQNNNANQLLRSLGYNVDECVTEPAVEAYHEYFLLDPEIPDRLKANRQINARGSSALVERYLQDQFLLSMEKMVLNPSFELDPALWAKQLLKSKKIPYEHLKLSEEKKQKLAQNPPKPFQVQVAEIKAQTEMELAKMDLQLESERLKVDQMVATAKTATERALAEAKLRQIDSMREIAILEFSNTRGMSAEQVKAKLADTVMKLRVQKELSAADHRVDLHKHYNPQKPVIAPPTEPAGRAPTGEAFEA